MKYLYYAINYLHFNFQVSKYSVTEHFDLPDELFDISGLHLAVSSEHFIFAKCEILALS